MEIPWIESVKNRLRGQPLLWDTITTTGWSTLGKAVGFLIPFFIAAWFGVSSKTDAFFFVYGIILFLSGIFAPVMESVIVPYIVQARKRGDEVGKFVGRCLTFSGGGLLVFVGLLILIIKPVLSVVTRFNPSTLNLVYRLLLEISPLILLLVWTSILNGTLNAYKKFAFPAVSPAFRAIINLGVIFAFKNQLGIRAIALGYVVGELGRLIILLSVLKKYKLFKLRLSFQLDRRLREFFRTSSYQTLAMVAIWSKPVIDKAMASWLGEGSVSVLSYADRLYIIPITFLCTGLMATTLSHWSSRYYEGKGAGLKVDVKRAVKLVGSATLIIMLFLLLFRRPIVKLALGRGAFAPEKLPQVEKVWTYFLVGLLPYVIARIYFQAHLVLKNTRFLMIYAFCFSGLSVLFNYLLMKPFGVAGIALATTACYLFSALCLACFLYKKIDSVN